MVRLRGRQPSQRRPQWLVRHEPLHCGPQARMCDLRRQELEEAVELRRVASHRRNELDGVGLRGRLQRPYLELEPVAELLHSTEDAHGVALAEARVEQLDVRPDARLEAAARVDKLQREVRRATTGTAAL